jgi:Arabinose efflux permease
MEENKPILWNRNFIQCCISYIFMSFAFYMLMPTIPVYLVEVLNIEEAQVGIILSSYTIGLMIMRPFSGYLADSFSRKPLYFFSFLAFAIMFCGYIFATTIIAFMAVRLLQGVFMGLTSVAGNTIAIDVIPSQRRGEGMGYYGFMLNISMSLAPLLAVYLYDFHGFHPVVYGGMILAMTGVITVSMIKYPKREKAKRPSLSLDRFFLKNAIPSAISYMLCAIPYGMIVSFVVLYGKDIEISTPGYFFIYMSVGLGMARLISGKLVDRGKIHIVSVISQIILTITFAAFAIFHTEIAFFSAAFMIGVGFGISVPAFQCLFVNVAPNNMRGTATSTFLTSFDVGVGIGMLSAGFISSHYNSAMIYIAGAGSCFLSLLVYIYFVRSSYEKNKLKD